MNNTTRREFLKYGGALGVALGAGGLSSIARAQEVLKIGAVYVSPVAEIG
jgi:basic membrane protein A